MSSSMTWVLTTTIPTSFSSPLRCGASLPLPFALQQPGRLYSCVFVKNPIGSTEPTCMPSSRAVDADMTTSSARLDQLVGRS